MNDDLEPRLRHHLERVAGRTEPVPDAADLDARISARRRRATRGLGAALAIALAAGPLGGWALARSTEPDVQSLSAAGGVEASGADDGAINAREGEGGRFGNGDPSLLDADLDPVSARTTAEGLRLVVHSSALGQANGPCHTLDGVVRVGVVDSDLIDVRYFNTAPGGTSFLIAGTADDRPTWVVVVRGYENVEATFPNGATDAVESTDGLAVLAAYADQGQAPAELAGDVIQLEGEAMVDMTASRTAVLDDGTAGCGQPPTPPPVGQEMPEPGEPPADEAAARDEITDTFLAAFDGANDRNAKAPHYEQSDVWLDASGEWGEIPSNAGVAEALYAEVHEVVFTTPDRASVRFSLLSRDTGAPALGSQIGEAVLIDGEWKVAIETSCALLAMGGVECDL